MRRALIAFALSLATAAPAAAQHAGARFWPVSFFPIRPLLYQLPGAPAAYREDSAHVNGHYGQFVLAVRNDAGGTLCGTTGDYCPFQLDATGQLRVAANVTNALLSAAVIGNAASGTADSQPPVKVGGVFNTTQPTVTTGQRVDFQATARGEVMVAPGVSGFSVVQGNAGTNAQAWWVRIGDATNGPAAVKAASTAAAAADASLVVGLSPNSALPTGANTIGALTANQSVNVNQVAGAAASTAASGVLKVGLVGNAGGVVDAANNAAAPANEIVQGDELQSGAHATAGTAGQVGRVVAGLDHVQYARLGGPVYWHCGVTAIGTTLTQCKAAPAAGLKAYVTDVTVISDTASAGQFTLRYGTGSNCATGVTTLFPDVASITAGKIPYPANTASQPTNYSFLTPLQPAAANAVCVVCIATQTCTVTMQGFEGS